ncbi:MAG: glycosyltransferase family protein, partial [Parcubacteria group bacterium]|nr:glycosyltransferase family protein [Parcubacteria group bacterium]
MKKTAIIIQARMSSTRLPGKVMKNLSGRPMLWQVITRCQKSKLANQVIVATTERAEDAVIEELCRKMDIPCFKGSLANVLERYYRAATEIRADVVVRITSDCPLIDPVIIDLCLNEFAKNKYDYISNVLPGDRTFPRGLDVEVFSFSALKTAFEKATETLETEHVTPYIWQNKKGHFTIGPM